jgi:hypothetical protein
MKAKYYIGIILVIMFATVRVNAQNNDVRNFRNDDAKIVVNNYYDDYYYSSRINRFHRSYAAFDYYAPVYTDTYFYDYQPLSWGLSIYGGFGFGLGLGFSYNYPAYNYGYNYSYYPYYGSSFYWGYNPFYYNTWYSPVVINFGCGYGWNHNYYGWNGYNHGYNHYGPAHYEYDYDHNESGHNQNYTSGRYESPAYSSRSGSAGSRENSSERLSGREVAAGNMSGTATERNRLAEQRIKSTSVSETRRSSTERNRLAEQRIKSTPESETRRNYIPLITREQGTSNVRNTVNQANSNIQKANTGRREVKSNPNSYSNMKNSYAVNVPANRSAVQRSEPVKRSSVTSGASSRILKSAGMSPRSSSTSKSGNFASSGRSSSPGNGSRSFSSGEKSARRR